MGLYDKTPVYLRMQELIRLVYSLSTHVSREYKYTLMQDIKRDVMNLTRYVFRANTADDKRPHLDQLAEEFEFVRMELRLCFDLRLFGIEKQAQIIRLLDDIGRQINGWRKSCK